MAGAFTHTTICFQALSERKLSEELKLLLSRRAKFVYLGSISPDIPYLAFEDEWANTFHWTTTNANVRLGQTWLQNRWRNKSNNDEACLAWLYGYTAHLVADAVIHPIVTKIVGPCSDETTLPEHRICEMMQDSLVFKDVRGTNIRHAEFTNVLRTCLSSPEQKSVFTFWNSLIRKNYPNKGQNVDSRSWCRKYLNLLDIAEGGGAIARMTRHIVDSGTSGVLYATAEELRSDHAADVDRYYNSVLLPKGGSGNFIEHGFVHSVRELVTIWNELYKQIATTSEIADVVQNWNLDTGIDSNEQVMTFWRT